MMTLSDSLFRFRLVSPLVPPAGDPPERAEALAGLWLDPRVFDGLDPAEVPGLTDPERAALRDHVARFTEIAGAARSAGRPTPAQVAEARGHFAAARGLIDRRLGDPAALALAGHLDRLIRDGRLPPWVLAAGVETGPDHDGDPSVFVTVVIPDAVVGDGTTFRDGIKLRDAVRGVQREHLPRQADQMLYVNHLPEGDLAEKLDLLPDPE